MTQLSCKSSEHYTPTSLTETIRGIIGEYFDPCTTVAVAKEQKILCFRTKDSDQEEPWPSMPVYCNPPGRCGTDAITGKTTICGNKKTCSCRLPLYFFQKCVDHVQNTANPVIYLAYSVNQARWISKELAITTGLTVYKHSFPSRIAYVSGKTTKAERNTPCDSEIYLLTNGSRLTRTHKAFKETYHPTWELRV